VRANCSSFFPIIPSMLEAVAFLPILFIVHHVTPNGASHTFRVHAAGVADAAVAGLFQLSINALVLTAGPTAHLARFMLLDLANPRSTAQMIGYSFGGPPRYLTTQRLMDVQELDSIFVVITVPPDMRYSSNPSSDASSETSSSP